MKNRNLMIGVAIVIAVGSGFCLGMLYQRSRINTLRNNFVQGRNDRFANDDRRGANNFTRMGSGGMMRGGMVAGEVTAKDDKSLTIKLTDGSSRIVLLSSDTSYAINSEAKGEQVSVGTNVAVFGSPNSDNSVTANSIEINPVMRGQSPNLENK